MAEDDTLNGDTTGKTDNNQNENDLNGENGPRIRWGSSGRSTMFDPFRRTKNLPFAIYGRRRSISVFTPINENDNA